MRWIGFALCWALMMIAGSAAHAAETGCPKDLVCASVPETIVEALKAKGYRAELSKEKAGDPMIKSAAAGYNYTIYFYGCDDHKNCTSLQFLCSFEADGTNTPALANKWNNSKRFSQMAVTDDGGMDFSYDVSTIGGLNKENFGDVAEWWDTMLGQVGRFFREQTPPAK